MDMIKFASFISYLTAMMNSGDRGKLANHEIENVKNHIDGLVNPIKVNLYPLFDAIVAGKKIDAIKAYRELTGEGLLESKNAIERLPMKMQVGGINVG